MIASETHQRKSFDLLDRYKNRDTVFCCCCNTDSYFKDVECRIVYSNVRAFQTESFNVWRCPDCRSLHRKENVDLDRYYAEYPYQNRSLDWWTRKAFSKLRRTLQTFGMRQESKILDYGCGEGIFLDFLKENQFQNCGGFDPFSTRYNDPSVLNQKYDVLLAQDVLEHVPDPVAQLKEWRALLKPGGFIFIGTPNAEALNLGNSQQFIHSFHQPYHLHIYSLSALKKSAVNLGFEVQASQPFNYFDTLWPSLNWAFLQNYLRLSDNTLNAAFEPPNIGKVLRSPKLWLLALFGRLIPPNTEMMVILRA